MTAIVELSFVASLDNWMERMNTCQPLKAQIDLRRIVAQDLPPAPCRSERYQLLQPCQEDSP